jgi:hypothetical protein
MTAAPDQGYRVKSWHGTDSAPAWNNNNNTVTMYSDRTVTVEFEVDYSRTINVFGNYPGIQAAVDDANNGDIIKIHDGTYVGTEVRVNKNITIIGNPDDPNLVVIDCGGEPFNAFTLVGTGGGSVVLNGITVINSMHGFGTFDDPAFAGMNGTPTQAQRDAGLGENTYGAIIVQGDHAIVNCIVRNCISLGTFGANGTAGGDPEDEDTFSIHGGDGGWGGNAAGGGIYVQYGNPSIINCLIDNCRVIGRDGGNGASGFVFDVNEDPNVPVTPSGDSGDGGGGGNARGGGIYIRAGSPLIKDCTISNCSATAGNAGNGGQGVVGQFRPFGGGEGGLPGRALGGGVYCPLGSNPTFINCTITNCGTVGGFGGDGGDGFEDDDHGGNGDAGYGGLTSRAEAGQPDSRLFSANGGGVYCGNRSSATFINCTISNNTTKGSISGQGGFPWIRTQLQPQQNYIIPSFGAGVYCDYDSGTTFTKCTIQGNQTTHDQDNGGDPNVTDPNDPNGLTQYTSGTYTGIGGGVCFWSAAGSTLTDCNILDNFATAGGGIYGIESELDIADCNFFSNSSFAGAGLLVEDSEATISRSIFRANTAASDVAEANEAFDVLFGTGGGLYIKASYADIFDCVITENDASLSGGGVCFDGDYPFVYGPALKNCLVTDNTAGREGGGIASVWFAAPTISNCTIADNAATGALGYGGGLYASFASYVTVIDSIIWGNTGINGSQIAIEDDSSYLLPSVIDISYSDIQGFVEVTESIDVVFAIDATGSMFDDINAVQEAATEILGGITDFFPDFRIAVVDYKDFNQPNLDANEPDPYGGATDYPYRTVLEFSRDVNDVNEIVNAIDSLEASGGGDGPESVLTALMHCIDHNSLAERLGGELYGADANSVGPGGWRTGDVKRVIIIMADAIPHMPPDDPVEPFTNYVLDDIIAAANTKAINIYSIIALPGYGDTAGAFGSLADDTGGSAFEAADATEVVGAFMDAIELITRPPAPIYRDETCTLTGWEPNDPNNPWDPNDPDGPWSADSNNIIEDPNFIYGYYLSQFATGHTFESNCVDGGSGNVNEPSINLPPDEYTTRTDGVGDVGIVDMGYHYLIAPMSYLNVIVVDANGDPVDPNLAHGYVDPNNRIFPKNLEVELVAHLDFGYRVRQWTGTDDDFSTEPNNTVTMTEDKTVTIQFEQIPVYQLYLVVGDNGALEIASPNWIDYNSVTGAYTYFEDTVVTLIALPDPNYRVKAWTGTDDNLSVEPNNTVTMDENKIVTVEFELPRMLSVPISYSSIQEAFDEAREGDEILVAPGTYVTSTGYLIYDKDITISGTNPDDPCVVAQTVIRLDVGEGGGAGRGFTFINVGPKTVLNGITIKGFYYRGLNGDEYTLGDNPNISSGKNGTPVAGGGIICAMASPTIKNCIITDCNIIGGNGVDGEAGDAEDPNGGHGGWPGFAYGGGMACLFDSHPAIINCTFRNCFVNGGNGANGGDGSEPYGLGGKGGGWYYTEDVNWPYGYHLSDVLGLGVEREDSPFYGVGGDGSYDAYTKYTGLGGAAYVGPDCAPTFTSCTFINNHSFGGTSGICGIDGPSGLRREPSINWQIDNFGGAVYCDTNSTPKFVDCEFTDNEADPNYPANNNDEYVSRGGAVAFEDGAAPTFEGCTFNDNRAAIGGAMYSKEAVASIDNCNFMYNLAYEGGGLYCIHSPEITITDCTFKHNRVPLGLVDPNGPSASLVGQGGGIYCWSTPALIQDCVITRNTANTSGGGVYLIADSDSPELINCLITDNVAGRDGGGVSVNWYAKPLIANCTIVGNVASGLFGGNGGTGLGGGFYCAYFSNAEIIDSILWNNYALEGSEIAVGTGFEFDPIPSILTVSYSDVKGGQSAAHVDNLCTLNWGYGNINTDPLFVTGPLGDYYLSQTDAGQLQDSPCVDTGSDLATNLDMTTNRNMLRYTTRTDEVLDRGIVDMGYHYTATGEPCRFSDLVYDGIINFSDFAILALSWLNEDCSEVGGWCGGADLTLDTHVDFDDLAAFVACWLIVDDEAPKPDPSEWEIEPYSASATSIAMTAETAVDAWGWDVEYYFECITDEDFNSPDWQSSPTYEAAGLTEGIEYCFKVRARDGIPWIPDNVEWLPDDGTGEPGNKTDWSQIRCALAGGAPDTTPPQPPPEMLTVEPNSPNSITMTATIAYDGSGVEYFFECTSVGGHDSGWLNEPNWTDTGLDPNTEYCYRVKARDKSPQQNETGWSDPLCGTTTIYEDEDETAPDPDPMQWDPNGLPHEEYHGGGSFDYWAVMDAVQATDDSGFVEYKFICSDGRYSSGGEADPGPEWRNETNVIGDPWHYEVWVGQSGRIFEFQVVARDLYGNVTAPSPPWPMN